MRTFLTWLGPYFEWLITNSIQAAVLVVVLWLVMLCLGKRLSPGWRHALWCLVLIRLIFPFSPESGLSIYNLRPWSGGAESIRSVSRPWDSLGLAVIQPKEVGKGGSRAEAPVLPGPRSSPGVPSAEVTGGSRLRPAELILHGIPALWLAGILILGTRLAVQSVRFHRRIKPAAPVADGRIEEIFTECKALLRIRRTVGAVETPWVQSPAIYGMWRPMVLFPAGILRDCSREELRHIILHEMAHLKRRDLEIHAVMKLLVVFHWINPLVWLAGRRMLLERELATDARVLSCLAARENTSYGQSIIKLLEQLNRPAPLPGTLGILEKTNHIERRMKMIAEYPVRGWSHTLAPIVLLAVALPTFTAARTDPSPSQVASEGTTPASTPNVDPIAIETKPDRPTGQKLTAGEIVRILESRGATFSDDAALPDQHTHVAMSGENVTDVELRLLADLGRIESVMLYRTAVTDSGLAALSELRGLQELGVFGGQTTGEGLQNLADLHQLRQLEILSEKSISSGIVHLSGLTGLQSLWLNGDGVGDKEFAHLTSLTNLTRLEFNGRSQFTDQSMHRLEAFPRLNHLGLGWTRITDDGLRSIGQLTNLTRLSLVSEVSHSNFGGEGITDRGFKELQGLTRLEHLSVMNAALTDEGLSVLEGMTELKGLALASNPLITSRGLQHLSHLTQLESLYLWSTGITDEGLQHLAGLTHLNELRISGTEITDQGLVHLQGLTQLRILDLGGIRLPTTSTGRTHIRDDGLLYLSGLARLESLALDQTFVTDAGLTHLASLPALKNLGLAATQVSDAGLEMLVEIDSLENLNLNQTRVTDAGILKLQEARPELQIYRDL